MRPNYGKKHSRCFCGQFYHWRSIYHFEKFLAATNNKENVSFIALVHSAKELKESYPWVKFIEFPEVKGSWLKRLHFEYVVCKKLSKELNATHWICLHDITANVVTKKRYVYCHNPAPFYKGILFREILMEPSFFLFKMLYGLIYKINIKKILQCLFNNSG